MKEATQLSTSKAATLPATTEAVKSLSNPNTATSLETNLKQDESSTPASGEKSFRAGHQVDERRLPTKKRTVSIEAEAPPVVSGKNVSSVQAPPQDPPEVQTQDKTNPPPSPTPEIVGLRDYQWERLFQRLVQYKEEHGNTTVPTKYSKDRQLGTWVRNQRLAGKKGKMSEERKRKLNDIGFTWNTISRDRNTATWEEMFLRLVEYKKKHGSANVPFRYHKDVQLGTWVNYQRTVHRLERLSVAKVKKLNSIGFEWNPHMKHAATWEAMFWRLVAYKKCFGHTSVPFRYKPDPQLGYWVTNQRTSHRKNKLSPERKYLLEALGVFSIEHRLTDSFASKSDA